MKRLGLLVAFLSLSVASFADHLTMDVGEIASLPECGGTLEVTNRGGQVNLVFRDVSQCSNFDILAANFDDVNYRSRKLQGSNQDRYGSFTLPMKIQDYGFNTIEVVVKSNSGKHQDRIKVMFNNLPIGGGDVIPVPVTGGGC